MPKRRLLLLSLCCLALITGLSFWLALSVGGIHLGPSQLLAALIGPASTEQTLLYQLRLPRAVSAFAVGGLLALAGTLLQTLLRNPLADPYVLGISGGAAVGALGALLLGLGTAWSSGSSFAGAMLSMMMLFALAHGRGSWTTTRLLLTGVIIAAGWGAIIKIMLAISDNNEMRSIVFWLMGDLSQASHPWLTLATLIAGLLLCLPLARSLTILSHGEMQAQALGVAVPRLRWATYFLTSILTAVAVTEAGSIGFVGLVVPHLVRLAIGNDLRLLLPCSVLLGGSLLLLADTVARTALAPQQLPVGVITAVIGVPLFLYLLRRSSSS